MNVTDFWNVGVGFVYFHKFIKIFFKQFNEFGVEMLAALREYFGFCFFRRLGLFIRSYGNQRVEYVCNRHDSRVKRYVFSALM